MFSVLEKRLLLAVLVLIWLCYLSYLVGKRVTDYMPAPPQLILDSPIATRVHQVRHVEDPFARALTLNLKPARNLGNPFYPNPTQPVPPPEPPRTRTLEVTYQGYYSTSQGEKRAYIRVDDQILVGAVGTKVVATWVIANISVTSLTLQDQAGKKLVLDFKTKKALTIPLS